MRFGDLGVSEHGVSSPNYYHSKRDDDESMESGVQYLFRLTNPKRKIMDIYIIIYGKSSDIIGLTEDSNHETLLNNGQIMI
jgi:hypothetical protein